jgi:azurin
MVAYKYFAMKRIFVSMCVVGGIALGCGLGSIAWAQEKGEAKGASKNKLKEGSEELVKVGIRVIPNQVKFDTTRFDVFAGAKVEVTFQNGCVLPHNFVLIDAKQESAILAGVTAMGLEGMEKHFVPEVPGILASSKLLAPQGQDRIRFTAPAEAGEYPYLCTFPGHWFTMRGVMRVVAAGGKLEKAIREKIPGEQVADALQHSGVTHFPMGTVAKPLVMRSFVPDPGLEDAVFAHHGRGLSAAKYDPKTREDLPGVVNAEKGIAGAIAVSHGETFAYVWDSTECRLMYAWRGGFLDMNPYWGKEPGSGRAKMYIPKLVGNLVFRTKGPHPLGDETPVFLGYEMKSGNPIFRYRMGSKVLRESVVPGANGFKLEITAESGGPAPSWRGTGNGIETVADGGLLKVLVADDASAK